MIKRELIHPRKVYWVMTDFINKIHNLTYEEWLVPCKVKEDETVEEFMERFRNATTELVPCVGKVQKGFKSCTRRMSDEDTKFFIWISIEEEWSKGSRQFTKDITERCPLTKGFATITLTLLHELGHLSSQQDFDGYDRFEELEKIHKLPKWERNPAYFKLPDEKAATDWAIEWLQNPNNRKIAKAFEKEFFKCFEKRA